MASLAIFGGRPQFRTSRRAWRMSSPLVTASWTTTLTIMIFGLMVSPSWAHITYIEARVPLEGSPPPPGSPWPLPQVYSTGKRLFELRPNKFKFQSTYTGCDIIDKALERYRKLIFLQKGPLPQPSGRPLLKRLVVSLLQRPECTYPHHGMDEGYSLSINESTATAALRSYSEWGVLRGLETFSQLVYISEKTNHYLVNTTEIWDWPRFSFRGILLDTARHFLPVKTIKENLEAMAFNKFNVLHWHIIDDQSWPYQMRCFPNITLAAYHPRLVYSQEDIQDIIEFARLRGIRVIPEIDTPGHSQALGRIFPDILTACYGPDGRGTPNYPHFAGHEMLNPMQDYTYDVMQTILQEVKETFPDSYIHLGMDEVYYDCWESSPEIMEFMRANNMSTVAEVEQYYVRRILENVKKFGAKYIIWQDPLDNGVRPAPETVIGVWRAESDRLPEYLEKIVKLGYQIVVSAPWYLNYIDYGQDWRKYYSFDPTAFPGTPTEQKLIIGGEACMWGEYVDATNLISRLWPRASAVGERLWSHEMVRDPEEAKWRLDEHRCRMIRRGIRAEPILNGYCGAYDWDV